MFVVLTTTALHLACTSSVNYADVFNNIQRVLKTKDELYGDGEYECYSNGECVMEYKVGDLVTYREEALCARSAEGCGESIMELRKREQSCTNMEEEYMQNPLCKRAEDGDCRVMLKKMEELECGPLILEKRSRKKREACGALNDKFESECGGKRRAITDECQAVMQAYEEEDCAETAGGINLQKRAKKCGEGWSLHGKVCYKYYDGPSKFNQALSFCAKLTTDQTSHLATLERAVTMGAEDTAFFQSLIESSGSVDKIDKVLSQMTDSYVDGDWQKEKTYYDNWAWIGVKKVKDVWRWVSPVKEAKDWNEVTYGQPDWISGEFRQPSKTNSTDIRMDHGNCVSYFQEADSDSDVGSWWNVACGVSLPYICEKNPQ